MRYRHISCVLNGSQASIRLSAPAEGVSINEDIADEIKDCCSELQFQDAIRVVAITGPEESFAVGRAAPTADVVDASVHGRLQWIARMSVANRFAALPMPTIAVLNGDATGHGLELAMAADLRVAVDTAKFGVGCLQDDVFPYDGATQRLPRLVGPGLARDMLLTGRVLSAHEALEAGLVNRVVPKQDLSKVACELADSVAAAAPIASRYAKEAVAAAGDLSLAQGLRLEADLSVILQSTEDRAEGLTSFAEKRAARFDGR